MTDVLGRFFCHECNVEKDRVTQDFTCTTCQSGFIGKCFKLNYTFLMINNAFYSGLEKTRVFLRLFDSVK